MSENIGNFFTVTRQLAIFELDQWKYQQVNLEALLNDYTIIKQQLQEAATDKAFFSDVHKTTYGIGLTEVQKEAQASEVDFLRNRVKAHRQADELKLSRYEAVKPYLSSLRKLVNWFDDVFSDVSKKR